MLAIRTILYIEDDQDSRRLVERCLKNAGYHVLLARRGLEGMDMARTTPPDLILTDIDLPDLSGYEIATALRGDSRFIHTPIVALTADGYKNKQEMAMAAGITGYLIKPVDANRLLKQIEYYLEGGQDVIDAQSLSDAKARYTQEVVSRLETRIRQLEKANEALMRLDSIKEKFIQITAHELRTPLTLIYGYSRLLEDYPTLQQTMESDEGMRVLVGGLVDSITRMHSVIDEILTISRIMTNQVELSLSTLDMGALVHKVISGYAEALKERALTVYFDLDQWPRYINADVDLVRIAVNNLLGNAIKYTPDSGEIFLEAEVVGDYVRFAVRDTGIGIDPSDHAYIFEHFHSIGEVEYHSTSKTAFGGGGLGLGLPIAKGIIEAHGGQIWVESPGRDTENFPGSQFNVVLPLGIRQNVGLTTKRLDQSTS